MNCLRSYTNVMMMMIGGMQEYVLIGLDMLNTILRRGLSPLEADDFDELEDDDLYLDEVRLSYLYILHININHD